MLRLLHGTNYDFIKWWKHMAILTVVWILVGVALFFARGKGINKSIDFTGGTLMQLEFKQAPDVGDIRTAVEASGVKQPEVQQFGSDREFTVRAQDHRDGKRSRTWVLIGSRMAWRTL